MTRADSLMYPEFMAFMTDEASVTIARAFAETRGWPAATVQSGGIDLFGSMMEAAAPPRLVVVDLEGEADPVNACQRLVNMCGPSTKIITVGMNNDVRLYRSLLQAGAVDYLVKPLSIEAFNQAIQLSEAPRAASGGPAPPDPKACKLIVLIGVHGGVGASTLALNLGWVLAEDLKHNTALIDLDLHYGACALGLDVEPSRGMRDLLASPQRVDSLMIASSLMVAGKKLSVMSTEEAVGEALSIDPAAVLAIVKDLRENFDYIVVDLPRFMVAQQRAVLAEAQTVLLISDQSLAGARDVLRLKTWLKSVKGDLQQLVVTTRHSKERPPALDQASFEKGIAAKIDAHIPDDVKVLNNSANAGKAFVATSAEAPCSKAVRDLGKRLAASATPAEEIKKIGGLFGGLKSKGKS